VNYKWLYSLKVAILFSWGLVLLLTLFLIGPQRIMDSYGSLTPQGIRDFVSSFGLLSAMIYVFLHAVRSFVFLPVTPLTIAGGYLFGTPLGLVLTLAGRTILSATITFYLSRHLLRDYIKNKIRGRYAGWGQRLERDGIFYVILMRVVPLFPYDAVGYVAGASGISFKKYLAGTIIGDFPAVLVLTVFGSSLNEPGSSQFYLSIIVALVAMAVSGLYFKLFMRKRARETSVSR
jgi:uncharacterized membrane protein YdjX (TVP38/TMEM64 family)